MNKYTIENNFQKLVILDLGATIYQWFAFDDKTNIVITNNNLEDYTNPNNGFLSSTVGRVANRINAGKFSLNGINYQLETNFSGGNHGHGGTEGFYSKTFHVLEHAKTKLVLKYRSPHLESGYPGNLDLFVTYELIDNQMLLTYKATTDMDTIINITNHAYFNLSHESNILNHSITAPIYQSLDTNKHLVPTGAILNNKGSLLDFTKPKVIRDIVADPSVYEKAKGLDHYFLFNKNNNTLSLTFKNRTLMIESTYPGLQIYTMQHELSQPLLNRIYEPYAGVALEFQYEPDAINHNNFNSIVLKKEDTYLEKIKFTLTE